MKLFRSFNTMNPLRKAVNAIHENTPMVFHILPTFLVSRDIELCKELSAYVQSSKRYNCNRLNFLAKAMQQMVLCKQACLSEEGKLAKSSTSLREFLSQLEEIHSGLDDILEEQSKILVSSLIRTKSK